MKPVFISRSDESISCDNAQPILSLLKIEKDKMSESGDEEVMTRENERIPLLSDVRREEEHEQQLGYWQRLKQRRKR